MGHLPSEKKAITGKCNGYTHKQQIQIPPLTPPPHLTLTMQNKLTLRRQSESMDSTF